MPLTTSTGSLADGLKPGDEWPIVEAVMAHASRVLLYGPPGTGKTHIANRFGNPARVFNVYLTDETPAAELRGHFVPRGAEWLWMHGPAMAAWLGGARLVLNEINVASGDALDFLTAVLDDPDLACLDLPNGETVRPLPGFCGFATMNGELEDLPERLQDRFDVKLRIERPHPDAIASLPADLQPLAIAQGNAVDGKASIRSWQAFANLREKVDPRTAAIAVFGPEQAQAMLDALAIADAR